MRYEGQIRDHFTVTSVGGDEFLCLCPFHPDTSQGHLYVNGSHGAYLCFSCGAHGSLTALELPRVTLGSDDVRERIRRLRTPPEAPPRYPESWLLQYDMPHDYWSVDRGLDKDVIDLFRLGYDPFLDRCTMPLRDVKGNVLGVTLRRLDDGKPKYLHPKRFPVGRHLYGAWLVTDQWSVALVEGQVDAIRGWSCHVPALSLMGARITNDQVKVLQRLDIRRVVLMLDRDNAGTRGTIQVYEALKHTGIIVKVGYYRPYWTAHDPDELPRYQYRKMYHSPLSVFEWAKYVS